MVNRLGGHRLRAMPAVLSATDIAFAMNAVMQGVFCTIWLLGSWVIGDVRRAALHWSAFAGLSAMAPTSHLWRIPRCR